MSTATCPAWCTRDRVSSEGRQHGTPVGSAEHVDVALVLTETASSRRAYIAASDCLGGLALLLPADAFGLAAILARLGHPALAALITRTAEMAGGKS